jgi:hypothetical protein
MPEPLISGPSFLGLNQPAPTPTPKRATLSIYPDSAPGSRNLDYLLEDEEPKSGGGGGKIILIVVALLLAAGFGYLRWRHQGLGWLSASAKKPPAATQPADSSDDDGSQPGGSTAGPSSPPTSGSATTSAAASSPAATNSTDSNATPAGGSTTPTPPANAGTANSPGADKSSGSPAGAAPATAKSTHAAPPVPAPVKPKPAPAAKPTAAISSAQYDSVAQAQRYLYGKGVRQDCDHGLRLLKPAADRANPKAMVEMGALYSAGLCTPRDLPTAYRWFALALRKDPGNQSIATDLDKLWHEMTPPEQQLAIKLTQ